MAKQLYSFFMEISIYLQPFHAMKNLVIGGWTDRLQLTDRAVYQKVAQKGCCMHATKNTVALTQTCRLLSWVTLPKICALSVLCSWKFKSPGVGGKKSYILSAKPMTIDALRYRTHGYFSQGPFLRSQKHLGWPTNQPTDRHNGV